MSQSVESDAPRWKAHRRKMAAGYFDGPSVEKDAGCVTCETRGPKWCDEHAHLLIAADWPLIKAAHAPVDFYGRTVCTCGDFNCASLTTVTSPGGLDA